MDEGITITLTYAGQLAGEAGVAEETAAVAAETALVDVLRAASERHGGKFRHLLFDENDQLRRALVVSVDGTQTADPAGLSLIRNSEIFLMTPIAGG